MANKNQSYKLKDTNHNILLTPELERKKPERKGGSRKEGRRRSSLIEKKDEEDVTVVQNGGETKRPVSREERAQIKFGHPVYNKAALLFEALKESQSATTPNIDFDSEFERRRAYSLAFAAKRYEAILKDVLLDSSFYSSYYKLETFHHYKVMVMLLDFYEHNFCFSESARKKLDIDSTNHLDYIHDIQKAFFQHKVKLCSAFARNRIKACALSLDAMLPVEVKERGDSGSRHPLYAWVNPFISDIDNVLVKLKNENYILKDILPEEDEEEHIFSIDKAFKDLLVFIPSNRDDVYNSELAVTYSLIPMSKPRYYMTEVTRRAHDSLCKVQQKSQELLAVPSSVDDLVQEGVDIILTHPETGSLAAHICSFLRSGKRLYVFGCVGNKHVEMDKNLRRMGVKNFVLIDESFTNISLSDERWSSIKLIFCNPPCSKSGVVNLVDFILQEGADTALTLSKATTPVKIRGFAEGQAATIRTAFSFPLVQSVVYSTFSTHAEENESLVKRVLQEQPNGKSCFEMVSVLDDLKVRIRNQSELGTKCLKTLPSNEMNGFFATLLQRKIKEDTVRDVMERANKKGLLKKTTKSSKKKVPSSATQQTPNLTQRLNKQHTDPRKTKSSPKMLTKEDKRDTDDEARFKF